MRGCIFSSGADEAQNVVILLRATLRYQRSHQPGVGRHKIQSADGCRGRQPRSKAVPRPGKGELGVIQSLSGSVFAFGYEVTKIGEAGLRKGILVPPHVV